MYVDTIKGKGKNLLVEKLCHRRAVVNIQNLSRG